LQTAAAQQQAIQAQTTGQQLQNQMQAMQLKDEQLRRQLAPQFVQKDSDGKPVGLDTEGLYNAMLANNADPASIQAMRMQQAEMQKSLIGLSDAQLAHQDKVNGFMADGLESIRNANDKALAKTPAAAQAAPGSPQGAPASPQAAPQSSLGPAVPGTGGMPAGMLPNMPAPQDIGKAPAGTPESLGHPQDGSAPTGPESAISAADKGPKPITPEAQEAYQQFLVRAARMNIPIGQFKPVLTSTSDLDQAEAGLGLHAELMKQQKAQADIQEAAGKGAQGQAEAEAALWKPAGEGTLVNVRTGQMVHGVGSPNVEAFHEYVAQGGNPLNFASDQAAREASNPAVQNAKVNLAARTKLAEQVITQGDPAAAGKLLADGSLTLSELKSRGTTPQFITAATNAAQQYSPGYNPQKAEADLGVAKSPTNVAFFGSAKSLTDPGGTLDQLAAAAKDIPASEFKPFNSITDAYKTATGSGPMAKYAALALGVADDYSKVMGGGQGSDTSRNQALSIIGAKQIPEERDAALQGIRGAVGSQTASRIGNNAVLKNMYGQNLPAQTKPATALAAVTKTYLGHNYTQQADGSWKLTQ
jgi:hypothetical protein